MNQYYIGKEEDSIEYVKNYGEFNNKLFINNGLDKDKEYKFNKFERCTFSNISFNSICINNCDFSFTIFIKCYFKGSTLNQVSFKNCTFINCGFHHMKIENCNFFYTEWEQTCVKFEEIANSLPVEYNYRKRLCEVMASNWLQVKNIEEYNKFFFEGVRAKEASFKEIILRKDDYYKKNFNLYDSLKHIVKLIFSKLSGIVWGYGERIQNVMYSSIFVIFIYSLIFYRNDNITGIDVSSYGNALFISIVTFFNVNSGIEFMNIISKYLSISEYILGLVFMGMFVAYLFRSISSR